jgi:hypothetical protein
MQRSALPGGQVTNESVFFLGLHSAGCSNLAFLEYMCVGRGRMATGSRKEFALRSGTRDRTPKIGEHLRSIAGSSRRTAHATAPSRRRQS